MEELQDRQSVNASDIPDVPQDQLLQLASQQDATTSVVVNFAGASLSSEEKHLRPVFARVGTVVNFELFRMPDKQSKGAGKVTFAHSDQAKAAVQQIHMQKVDGRQIHVQIAIEVPDSVEETAKASPPVEQARMPVHPS